MKKAIKIMALLLCIITLGTLFSACSKEDGYQEDGYQRKIVGKWEVVHDYFDANSNSTFNPANFDHSLCQDYEAGDIWEFYSDGNVYIKSFHAGTGTYSIQSDKLVFNYVFAFNYNIKELTNSSLIIWMNKRFMDMPRYYEFKKVG